MSATGLTKLVDIASQTLPHYTGDEGGIVKDPIDLGEPSETEAGPTPRGRGAQWPSGSGPSVGESKPMAEHAQSSDIGSRRR